jgi:hypothetical protein
MEAPSQLRFSMVEITNEEGSRTQMMDDVRREWKLAASFSSLKLTQKQHKLYVEDAGKIRFEWVTNWIQKLMGMYYMLQIMNPEQAFPDFLKNQPPDWKWNKETQQWSDRYRSFEGAFKAYWVSFRDVATDVPLIVMTVQWFGDRSRHMYVARTLASIKKQIKVDQPLLLPLHSRVAYELWKLEPEMYKHIVSNPVQYVREFLKKQTNLQLTDKGGEVQITVTKEFMELWKVIEPRIEFQIWCY